jgi:hypothetical protein
MLEFIKIPKTLLKGKLRQLVFNKELNLYKRKRSLNGIEHLHHWSIFIGDYKDKKLSCLEIGSHEGQAANFILKKLMNNKESTLICVDPWIKSHWLNLNPTDLCYEDIFDFNKKNNDVYNQIEKFDGKGIKFYKSEKFKAIDKLDIIYIDDIHTEESTRLNILNCWDKLRDGGIIIFDDYNYKLATYEEDKAIFFCEPVKLVVDEFINKNKEKIKILHDGYQLILQKL